MRHSPATSTQHTQCGGAVLASGQIGFVAATMAMAPTLESQAQLAAQHSMRVLAAMGAGAAHVRLGLCFVLDLSHRDAVMAASAALRPQACPCLCVQVPALPRGALVRAATHTHTPAPVTAAGRVAADGLS